MSESKPPRRKPSGASAAFDRMTEATRGAPVVGGDAIGLAGGRPAAGGGEDPVRRFTVRFYDYGDTDALDQRCAEARKITGSKVDASRLVRELIREMDADAALMARVQNRLMAEERPART